MEYTEKGWVTIEPARDDGSTRGMIAEFEAVGLETRIENGILEVRPTDSTPKDLAARYKERAIAASN